MPLFELEILYTRSSAISEGMVGSQHTRTLDIQTLWNIIYILGGIFSIIMGIDWLNQKWKKASPKTKALILSMLPVSMSVPSYFLAFPNVNANLYPRPFLGTLGFGETPFFSGSIFEYEKAT